MSEKTMEVLENQAYETVLRDLYQRTASGIKLDLSVMRTLMRVLNEPYVSFKCIVVAGTNGKGSTSCMLEHALRRAGYRVGLFSSPHLLRLTERVRVNGVECSVPDIVDAYKHVMHASKECERQPTFFECITAVALLVFQRFKVDVAVLEVGLGGRLDATNVVPKELSVITSISKDHEEFLGHTLQLIAAEKAGVIQEQGDVVCGAQMYPEVLPVLVAEAQARNARMVCVPWDGSYRHHYGSMNQATVRAACGVLMRKGWRIREEDVDAACAEAQWPGRYQAFVYEGVDVLVDGAHNPDGMRALMERMHADPVYAQRPVHAVFSVVRSKDVEGVVGALKPHVADMSVCPVGSSRSFSVEQLQQVFPYASVCASFAEAFEKVRALAKKDQGVVLICGSLFLVADALAHMLNQPKDPPVDA